MQFFHDFPALLLSTFFDILPIALIIFGFQFLVIRKRVKDLKKVLTGMLYVLIGITFFLMARLRRPDHSPTACKTPAYGRRPRELRTPPETFSRKSSSSAQAVPIQLVAKHLS